MKRLMQTCSVLLILVGVFSSGPTYAFLPGNVNKNSNDFKELIRQREMEKEKSRQRLLERERNRPEPERIVRIHQPGDRPTKEDGDHVIATMKVSEEEIRNHEWDRALAKARAIQGRPQVESERSRSLSRRATDSTVNWTILGLLGLGVLGWWSTRKEEVI